MIPARRVPRHAAAFLAAGLLEVALISLFARALRPSPSAPGARLVWTGILRLIREPMRTPGIGAPPTNQRAPPGKAPRLALPTVADLTRSIVPPHGNFPASPPLPRGRVDWNDSAKRAAATLAGNATLTRQRLAASGELPEDTSPAHHAAFPWSHQPRIPWLDFDLKTLTTGVHLGKHCELAFFILLPGFGCVLGHLEPTTRGDLFDPILLPSPLQLPAAPRALRQKPGAPPSAPPGDPPEEPPGSP